MAANIHDAYDWQGHGDQCVTAVVRKRNSGRLVVFSQRFMTAMEDYARRHYRAEPMKFKPGGGAHLHAEMYAVLHYLLKGKDPGQEIRSIGVSKQICPLCQSVLDYLGIEYTQHWVTTEVSSHWIDPWDSLPQACKPAVPSWRKDPESDSDPGQGGRSDAIAV
jgi:hypothetical protein